MNCACTTSALATSYWNWKVISDPKPKKNPFISFHFKGIMNQKLPLFGLHGDSHVVSLSRNRMYVNLMSLENGDCVTTFKVGEDRFLNSLLVSDNGRILVCGDESKRPCSLLVWDLQAKKLIYDLKLNHHEFITRLSAITGEGTYVACVSKVRPTTTNKKKITIGLPPHKEIKTSSSI